MSHSSVKIDSKLKSSRSGSSNAPATVLAREELSPDVNQKGLSRCLSLLHVIVLDPLVVAGSIQQGFECLQLSSLWDVPSDVVSGEGFVSRLCHKQRNLKLRVVPNGLDAVLFKS